MLGVSTRLPYRKGFGFSVLLHSALLIALLMKLPSLLPQKEIQAMQVKLVTAEQVKKSTKAPQAVRSQQSDAPPAPPKQQPKPQPKPKEPSTGTKAINPNATKSIKAPEPKATPPAPEPVQEQVRPAKLDKTPDKENVLKDNTANPTPVEDDFLAALSFIDELEEKQSALSEGEDVAPTSVDSATQHEIAIIRTHIERNWYRPPGLAANGLSAAVEVHVGRDGGISSVRITQSSGDSRFDSSLLRAVRKSVPLPIPAEKYGTFRVLDLRFTN